MDEHSWMARTELLVEEEGIKKLKQSHVLIAGLGGVGSAAAEMVCRAGIGKLTIVDADVVQPSNRNRQLCALKSTQGRKKIEVVRERLMDINPDVDIEAHDTYLIDDTIESLLGGQRYDFAIDAIDTLTPKVQYIAACIRHQVRLVSAMGAGGKTDPSKIFIDDISKSYNCKLARYTRKYLHRLGIRDGFKVVYSTELIDLEKVHQTSGEQNKRSVMGTISYMPVIFGCFCASEVIRSLAGLTN